MVTRCASSLCIVHNKFIDTSSNSMCDKSSKRDFKENER